MSCADGGNFLCKKFHKTSHTLHSLITRKLNEPHERSAKLSSENAGCLQDFSDDTESRLTRMWFKNYETMTVFVVCFTNELLFIPLSWHFDSVICYGRLGFPAQQRYCHSEKTENLASSVDFRLIQNLSMLIKAEVSLLGWNEVHP